MVTEKPCMAYRRTEGLCDFLVRARLKLDPTDDPASIFFINDSGPITTRYRFMLNAYWVGGPHEELRPCGRPCGRANANLAE